MHETCGEQSSNIGSLLHQNQEPIKILTETLLKLGLPATHSSKSHLRPNPILPTLRKVKYLSCLFLNTEQQLTSAAKLCIYSTRMDAFECFLTAGSNCCHLNVWAGQCSEMRNDWMERQQTERQPIEGEGEILLSSSQWRILIYLCNITQSSK